MLLLKAAYHHVPQPVYPICSIANTQSSKLESVPPNSCGRIIPGRFRSTIFSMIPACKTPSASIPAAKGSISF